MLAAARARLPEIGRPSAQVAPITAPKLVEAAGDDLVASLEQELAASEAARAELIEQLQRAERSLAVARPVAGTAIE